MHKVGAGEGGGGGQPAHCVRGLCVLRVCVCAGGRGGVIPSLALLCRVAVYVTLCTYTGNPTLFFIAVWGGCVRSFVYIHWKGGGEWQACMQGAGDHVIQIWI